MNFPPRTYLLLAFLLLSIGLLAACSPGTPKSAAGLPALPSLPGGAIVQENLGRICFQTASVSTQVQGQILPVGCYSSACTRPVQQVYALDLDETQRQLRFQSRFVLQNLAYNQPLACTRDCTGGGSMSFDLGDLQPGAYSVWLGDLNLGQFQVPPPAGAGGPGCLSSEATATPPPAAP